MADERILQALEKGNSDQRKKAVAALGRSLDPQALPILAKVYRNDPDEDVREMARKAGAYIRRNKHNFTPEAAPDEPSPAPKAKAAPQPTPEPEPAEPRTHPLLELDLDTIKVSGANAERAKAALDQAISYDMHDERSRAILALRKALELDPRLREDEYTRGLTLQIAGGAGEDEAIYRALTMDLEAARSAEGGGGGGKSRLMALFMVIGGALMAAGFLLPWLVFPTGSAFLFDDPGAVIESPQYSGLDIFNNTDDVAVTLSQIAVFNDIMRGNFSMVNLSRNPVTYSPALTAAAGGLLLLFGVLGVLGGVSGRGFWLLGVVLALAAVAAPVWFYVTVNDFVSVLNDFLFGMDGVELSELTDTGFFVTVGGVALALLGALLGVLTSGGDG